MLFCEKLLVFRVPPEVRLRLAGSVKEERLESGSEYMRLTPEILQSLGESQFVTSGLRDNFERKRIKLKAANPCKELETARRALASNIPCSQQLPRCTVKF